MLVERVSYLLGDMDGFTEDTLSVSLHLEEISPLLSITQ